MKLEYRVPTIESLEVTATSTFGCRWVWNKKKWRYEMSGGGSCFDPCPPTPPVNPPIDPQVES